MKGFAVVALVSAACGGKAVTSPWVERDAHATGQGGGGGEAAELPVDLATLDRAAIDRLDEATVRAGLAQVGDNAPAAKLALRAARLAHHRGDDDRARADLLRATAATDEPSVHAELVALGAAVPHYAVDAQVIAVLLPLSGPYAGLGRELGHAIQLVSAPGLKWVVIDTKGDPAGATAAVEQADEKGAVAILGPVGEREGVAAARAATLHGIPIALLSPADGADASVGVFRVVDSPADEGRAVAQLAADQGFPTVGVFAPRDDGGRDAAEAFAAEASRLGLQVTAQGTYDPTGGSLEPDVKTFLNLVPGTNPRLAAHLRRGGKRALLTFTPDIPYSLLYMPDRADRAALVAAYLPYYNVELRTQEFPDPAMLQRKHGGVMPQVVQLVGGAGWNDPTIGIRGGAALQGALVVDTFSGTEGSDTTQQFSTAFLARAGHNASTAAAQAYDGALVMAASRARAGTSGTRDLRLAFRDALATATLDDGACGPAQMGADGELHREPIVLEIIGESLIVQP